MDKVEIDRWQEVYSTGDKVAPPAVRALRPRAQFQRAQFQ
jgi:hypothetical protein